MFFLDVFRIYVRVEEVPDPCDLNWNELPNLFMQAIWFLIKIHIIQSSTFIHIEQSQIYTLLQIQLKLFKVGVRIAQCFQSDYVHGSLVLDIPFLHFQKLDLAQHLGQVLAVFIKNRSTQLVCRESPFVKSLALVQKSLENNPLLLLQDFVVNLVVACVQVEKFQVSAGSFDNWVQHLKLCAGWGQNFMNIEPIQEFNGFVHDFVTLVLKILVIRWRLLLFENNRTSLAHDPLTKNYYQSDPYWFKL